MESLQENMIEFRSQLNKGVIQKAYLGLMQFMLNLKNHFINQYPDYIIPGNIYTGYLDMTYFSVIPKSLKDRELKIAIVFVFDAFRFEVWLSGRNQKVMASYWRLFTQSNWDKYKIVPQGRWADSVLEQVLVENPDFSDLDALTKNIEQGTLKFINDIESFLSKEAT